MIPIARSTGSCAPVALFRGGNGNLGAGEVERNAQRFGENRSRDQKADKSCGEKMFQPSHGRDG